MNTQKRILVIAEHINNALSPVSKELVACAKSLSKFMPITLNAVLIGENLKKVSEALSKTNIHVTGIELSNKSFDLKAGDSNFICQILEPVIRNFKPHLIIAGHTSFGISILPQLSINLDASCITCIKKIEDQKGELIFTRLVCNGKFESQIRSQKKITAITVLPGIFSTKNTDINKIGQINHIRITEIPESTITLNKISQQSDSDFSFDDADVIVAAGKGIGEIENLEKIHEFSKIFQKSAVAASRPLIDMGWIPYKHQVGITGKSVAPGVYIACGISGSSQHIAGMSKSEFIVAINSDKNASIFNISDLCIIEDIISFIELVLSM